MTRGSSPLGYRRTPRVVAIEGEYMMSFPDVIRAFISDGCNRSMVAGILEYDRRDFWKRLQTMARAGLTFDWPDGIATRSRPPKVNSEAQRAASIANLEKARAANAEYWRLHRTANHTLATAAYALRMKNLSWREVAMRLNVDPSTLSRARKRYKIHDPLGWKLKVAAQKKFSGSKSFAERTKSC